MKAYMLTSDKFIEPFMEHPGQCLIGNKKLIDWQKETLSQLGLELVQVPHLSIIDDNDEHIIFGDTLFFDKELLGTFIPESRKLNARTSCNLKSGITTLRTVVTTQDTIVHNGSVEYNLRYTPAYSEAGEVFKLVLNPDRFHESLPMPDHMFGLPDYKVPLPDKVAVQIDHWTNIWSANICVLLAKVAKLKASSKFRLLALATKAMSTNQWNILKMTNSFGNNCDIHPSAYIEGSHVGNNVRVGANSVIRESIIGDNCNIENNVTINFSVIGDKCYFADGSLARYSVLYPGTFLAFSPLSCSLIGRNSFMGGGVTLIDFRFDGKPVQVLKNGKVIDSKNTFLGSCLGHDVYIGAGTIISPGRTIPNGFRIFPENSRVIRKVDSDGPVEGYQLIKK